jgi:hypothetical protein
MGVIDNFDKALMIFGIAIPLRACKEITSHLVPYPPQSPLGKGGG